MRNLLPLLLMIVLVPLQADTVGRFVVVPGEIEYQESPTVIRKLPVMLKVDTATGDTWILQASYQETPNGEGAVMGWVKLSDDYKVTKIGALDPVKSIDWLQETKDDL